MGERRNIIFITIDAWRADYMREAFGQTLLPALEPYKKRRLDFTRMYANGPWTTPGLLSIFTGLSAAKHGVHFAWSKSDENQDALAKRFQAAGYHCPNLSYLNGVENYFNLGFDPQHTPARPKDWQDQTLIEGLPQSGPFFLWYHYKYVHLPYWPQTSFRQRFGVESVAEHLRRSVGQEFVVPRGQFQFSPDDKEAVHRLYAANILQMNAWLAGILQQLESRGLLEHSTLILTADHGEELLEHGFVGHASTAERGIVYDEVLRIPLIILDDRLEGYRQIDAPVQGVDLFSTLLGLADIEAPEKDGLNLCGAILGDEKLPKERPIYARSASMGYRTPRARAHEYVECLIEGKMKVIYEHLDEKRAFLFDLEADPQELSPLSISAVPYLKRMRALGGLCPATL